MKKVMVIGYYINLQENLNNMFDYTKCMYPKSVLPSNQTLLFNYEQIEKIIFNIIKMIKKLFLKKN